MECDVYDMDNILLVSNSYQQYFQILLIILILELSCNQCISKKGYGCKWTREPLHLRFIITFVNDVFGLQFDKNNILNV